MSSITEPLLATSSISDPNEQSTTTRPLPLIMVRKENFSIQALGVQLSALLFVAIVWSLVLSTMSFTSLPLFGYHPLIQSLAILMLLQAIVVLQRTGATNQREKKAAFQIHQSINLLLVLPLLTIGAYIMYYLHDQPGTSHWISYHGILGTLCVVVAWIQTALGAASIWFKGRLVGGESNGKALWKYHRLSGYLLIALFLFTAALGVVETTWGKSNSGAVQKWLVVLSLIASFAALLVRIQRNKLPKLC
ncbi:related to Cytochrome b561 [Ustilago trichophora]|uniref:Related to Cytochrome b561 n=1 Tax=Ustilago trichophora TaxID=86804 RepID=A0A5C3E9F6_9BASI|nr:related to Cytochrome b561 [Ustilago trichophora]